MKSARKCPATNRPLPELKREAMMAWHEPNAYGSCLHNYDTPFKCMRIIQRNQSREASCVCSPDGFPWLPSTARARCFDCEQCSQSAYVSNNLVG